MGMASDTCLQQQHHHQQQLATAIAKENQQGGHMHSRSKTPSGHMQVDQNAMHFKPHNNIHHGLQFPVQACNQTEYPGEYGLSQSQVVLDIIQGLRGWESKLSLATVAMQCCSDRKWVANAKVGTRAITS
jgi:hypothetical protein